jgi:hypothetical protein
MASGRAVIVGEGERSGVFQFPRIPEPVRPIFEILPVQMVSLALAATAGMEPGVFRLARKITATE